MASYSRKAVACSTGSTAFHRQMFAFAKLEKLWEWVRQQSGNLDRLRRPHVPLAGKAAYVI